MIVTLDKDCFDKGEPLKPILSQEMAIAYREGYILGRLSVLRKIKNLTYTDLLVKDNEIVEEFNIYIKNYDHLHTVRPEDLPSKKGRE